MRQIKPIHVVALAALLWLGVYGGQIGGCTLPVISPQSVTAVTYTYDDKKHSVPPPVAAALDKLNRGDPNAKPPRPAILADLDEVDTTNPVANVPKQFQASRPAAIAAGLPSLVVLAGDKVLRTVKDPKTEEAVLEAAK